jgi:hypothetical protein
VATRLRKRSRCGAWGVRGFWPGLVVALGSSLVAGRRWAGGGLALGGGCPSARVCAHLQHAPVHAHVHATCTHTLRCAGPLQAIARTHRRTCACTRAHTLTHAYRPPTCTHTRRAHAHMRACACTRAHMHMHTHTCAARGLFKRGHTRARAQARSCARARARARGVTRTRRHAHAHAHPCTRAGPP